MSVQATEVGGTVEVDETIDLSSGFDDTEALVLRAAAGSHTAWNQLVDRHIGWMWATARSYRLSEADAGDAVQTTWLRLLENVDRINDPQRVGAWLGTTLRRECLRLIAHGKRVLPSEPTVLDRPAQGTETWVDLVAEEERQVLHRAIQTLPRRWRELMLMLMEDPTPSYEEVSQRLGMPIGSIGPTRGRCLDRLRTVVTV